MQCKAIKEAQILQSLLNQYLTPDHTYGMLVVYLKPL